jgi:hypothetical protein
LRHGVLAKPKLLSPSRRLGPFAWRRVNMRKMILTVVAVLFLNVYGTYADVMMGIGGTVLFEGDGTLGFSAILPQAGWTSAKRETRRIISTEWDEIHRGIPIGIPITTF